MGRYKGNMPGGAQPNPARPIYEGSPEQYNLRIKTNRIVRKLPRSEWRPLQEEIQRRRRGGEVEQTLHDDVSKRVESRLENAA